jgi:hypothetical protein
VDFCDCNPRGRQAEGGAVSAGGHKLLRRRAAAARLRGRCRGGPTRRLEVWQVFGAGSSGKFRGCVAREHGAGKFGISRIWALAKHLGPTKNHPPPRPLRRPAPRPTPRRRRHAA